MNIEISLSCFGKGAKELGKSPAIQGIAVEKNDRYIIITYQNESNLYLEEMIDDFLKKISSINMTGFGRKLFRIAFFVYPSDRVAFFSTEIMNHSLSLIGKLGADLEVNFYPCEE
ncbi:hypothetical protein AAHN93_14210 [Vandammella animalimorsus]|uniref:hypothetical protein n=1 Tax=Vandammella animalimorsus TaxID=2029117 RepID=UPI001177E9E9|nr:hypothetical protein [Vandammella animalimorsus]